MKYNEAYNELTRLLWENERPSDMAILTALDALQKQIPNNAIRFEENLNDRTFYITECPNCNHRMNKVTNYCSYCGQALEGKTNEIRSEEE